MIAIIIPFYQRSGGLLRRALQSVIAQDYTLPCYVIVVDDGSPVSARHELAELDEQLAGRLLLICQSNRGVSAARNRGLDRLLPGTEVVAFLDSDDVWEAGHLSRLHAAIEAGADFY